jgi:hypothetical protein
MTSPQGMDELFWGRDHKDVNDWAERLTMAAEVHDLIADKLFKIAKLNLRGRAKEWFRILQLVPTDWAELRTLMVQKYGNVDANDIRMKMDAIKQEPKERVQKYFERLDKLFRKGQILDVEQKRRFLARLRPEIRKLCVVRTFTDIEELVGAATEVERVLGELGETPYEPLREEQEKKTSESNMEKQVNVLNNALINFFRENVVNPASSSYSIMFEGCQIYRRRDHVATTCPRLNEARLRYAKCNMPHRAGNSGNEHIFCVELGHSENRSWKRPSDGRSHFGAANFIKVLLHDEEATEGIEIGRKLEDAVTLYEEPRAEPSNTKKEHLNAVEDKISVEVVEAVKEIDNISELNEEVATIQQDQTPLAVEETDEQIAQAANDQITAEPIEAIRDLKKTATLVAEDITIKGELDAEMGKPFTSALPPSAFEGYLVNLRTIVRCTDEQQTQVTQAASKLVDVLGEAYEQGASYSRAEHGMKVRGDDRRIEAEGVKLPDSFVAPDHSSMISLQVTCQRPQGRDDSILRTVSRNAYKQHPYMQEFGSSISNRFANVEARTLPPLWLKYCDTGWKKNCLPGIGLWNMMHRKMVNVGAVKHWACINFSRCVTADIAHQCCNELTQMFRNGIWDESSSYNSGC